MTSNYFKTALLMILMMLAFLFVGYLLGGRGGLIIAFIFASLLNLISYYWSDKIVIAIYRCKQVSEADQPTLYRIVRRNATRAGLPMPKVYIMKTDAPNAFATGRNPEHGVVCVTTGIMDILNENELSGVIGHELAHIKNRDILIGAIVAMFAGAIMMLVDLARWGMIFHSSGDDDNFLVTLILIIAAPIAAILIQTAISRDREYKADREGARIHGSGRDLASALSKISAGLRVEKMKVNEQTAHFFILSPLSGKKLLNLFSTHPPVEERIIRLKKLEVVV